VLIYTSNHFWGDQITYALNGTSPASLDTTTWTAPDSLKAITCGQHAFPSSLNQWHATEYVGIGPNEYLSAFSDDLFNGGVIQFTQVVAPDGSCPSDSIRLDCPDAWTAVEPGAGGGLSRPIEFVNAGAIPAHGVARLRLSISRPGRIHVAVYDLLGRRVRTLMDGWMTDGATTLLWTAGSKGVESRAAVSTLPAPRGQLVEPWFESPWSAEASAWARADGATVSPRSTARFAEDRGRIGDSLIVRRGCVRECGQAAGPLGRG
jgi:hypothetical protein